LSRLLVTFGGFPYEYITAKALATRQTPEAIVAALVRKELAVSI
jgi:hypothetical protein